MNLILLLAVCAVAAVRPLYGFAAIFILTGSLFHLHQYFTVALPIGYVEPSEAILAVILIRAALVRVRRKRLFEGATDPAADRSLLRAVAPFCAWQMMCLAAGAIVWSGTDYFRYSLRYALTAVLPWAALFALRTFRKDADRLFRLLFHIAFVTAVVHIAIQVLDLRGLMPAAYWNDSTSGEYGFVARGHVAWLARDEFVRGLPQGLNLMLFCAVFDFATFLTGRSWRSGGWPAARGAVVAAALLITLTRTIAVSLLAGVLFAAALHLLLKARPGTVLARLAAVAAVCVVAALGYDAARPGFLSAWTKRFDALSGADSEIFSAANRARGYDNIASLRAIGDHPVLGVGTPRYPSEYSLRNTPPTDIHPLLSIGLVGGVPAILLMLNLQFRPILAFTRRIEDRSAPASILPHVAALGTAALALNLLGGGGTTQGMGVFLTAAFLAACARQLDIFTFARRIRLAAAMPRERRRPDRPAVRSIDDQALAYE